MSLSPYSLFLLPFLSGVAVNQAMAYHLLNKLREFNEWNACTVIETVEKYTPTEEETYDIMVTRALFPE